MINFSFIEQHLKWLVIIYVIYILFRNISTVKNIIRGIFLDIIDFFYFLYDVIKTIIIFLLCFSIIYIFFNYVVFAYFLEYTLVKNIYNYYLIIKNFAFFIDFPQFYELNSYSSMQNKLDYLKIEKLTKELFILDNEFKIILNNYLNANNNEKIKLDIFITEKIVNNENLKTIFYDGLFNGYTRFQNEVQYLIYLNKLSTSSMALNLISCIFLIIVVKIQLALGTKFTWVDTLTEETDPILKKVNELIDFGLEIWMTTPFYSNYIKTKFVIQMSYQYNIIKNFLINIYIYDYFFFIVFLYNKYTIVRAILLYMFLFLWLYIYLYIFKKN